MMLRSRAIKDMKIQGGFDELELLELFWVEPTQTEPEAGYWCTEGKITTVKLP
jgi:hypothetical protein